MRVMVRLDVGIIAHITFRIACLRFHLDILTIYFSSNMYDNMTVQEIEGIVKGQGRAD